MYLKYQFNSLKNHWANIFTGPFQYVIYILFHFSSPDGLGYMIIDIDMSMYIITLLHSLQAVAACSNQYNCVTVL